MCPTSSDERQGALFDIEEVGQRTARPPLEEVLQLRKRVRRHERKLIQLEEDIERAFQTGATEARISMLRHERTQVLDKLASSQRHLDRATVDLRESSFGENK